MVAQLNHTIVQSRDKAAAAAFLAQILGTAPPQPNPPFLALTLDNGVTLDFQTVRSPTSQHYAFLVDEATFDAAYARIAAQAHWADPMLNEPGRINHRGGGRGVYFKDPSGHLMELLTRAH